MVIAGVLLGSVLLGSVAGIPAASAADDPGLLRIAHLSPDTPAVDVAVAPSPSDGAPLTDPGPDLSSGLGYGGVGDFSRLPAGSYAVSLRAAGSAPTVPPLLSARVAVPPAGAVTVALRGRFADLVLDALPEDLRLPTPGSARVRVLAAAAGADPVDVVRTDDRAVLASGLPFGGAGNPVTVPAGPAVLRIGSGGGAVDVPADLAPGSVLTLLVLDRPGGGIALRVVPDAAAPAVVPTGGVDAGGGPAAGFPLGWSAVALACSLVAVRRRRRLVLLAAAALVAGLVPVAVAPRAVPDAPEPVVLVAPAATAHSPPTRVQVPTAGIDAPVGRIGLDAAGSLVAPDDGATAGWYAGGTTPGAAGPAVLTGHVDGAGEPAVFARLDEVRPGDPVLVGRADGTTLRFVVTRVARYPKDAFPTAEVYGPTTGPELRLITCGGRFDRAAGSYVDNVVIDARPAGGPA